MIATPASYSINELVLPPFASPTRFLPPSLAPWITQAKAPSHMVPNSENNWHGEMEPIVTAPRLPRHSSCCKPENILSCRNITNLIALCALVNYFRLSFPKPGPTESPTLIQSFFLIDGSHLETFSLWKFPFRLGLKYFWPLLSRIVYYPSKPCGLAVGQNHHAPLDLQTFPIPPKIKIRWFLPCAMAHFLKLNGQLQP